MAQGNIVKAGFLKASDGKWFNRDEVASITRLNAGSCTVVLTNGVSMTVQKSTKKLFAQLAGTYTPGR